ncbi:unnamed protein product [Chrysoparadoxa australica]
MKQALGAGLLLSAALAGAQETTVAKYSTVLTAEQRESIVLTVYGGATLVGDKRNASFSTAGLAVLGVSGLPSLMRPESFTVEGNGVTLREHQMAYEAQESEEKGVSPQQLFKGAFNKPILVRIRSGADGEQEELLDGTLVSLTEPAIVQVEKGLRQVSQRDIIYPTSMLEEGLTKVALTAQLEVDSEGETGLEITYLTGGISWTAHYTGMLNVAESAMALHCTAAVTNNSGMDYNGVMLRLMSGSISQVSGSVGMAARGTPLMYSADEAAPAQDSLLLPAGDQHLYQFSQPVDLANRATKQLRMEECSSEEVPVIKEYRFTSLISPYRWSQEVGPVGASIALTLQNEEAAGLGKPLPGGIARMYTRAEDDSRILLGEDRIQQTPVGNELELSLGLAFDVTGKAELTAFDRLSSTVHEVAQNITVRNAKDEDVQVKVVGDMPTGWAMVSETQAHTQETAARVAWVLEVPAGADTLLSYRIRITRPEDPN